jgi:RND superfamily putative drug exporter
MRHPIAAVVGCALVLGTLASPVWHMRTALPDSRALPRGSEVRAIDEALSDPARFDPGGAAAIPVIVEAPRPVLEPDTLRAARAVVNRLAAVPGVANVRTPLADLDPDAFSPAELARRMAQDPTASELQRMVDGDAALLVVEHPHAWRSPQSVALVEALRAVEHPGLLVRVGGPTAGAVDLNQAMRTAGPFAALLVAAANLAILLVAFRSVVVPVKAIVMNVLSLGASYGVLVWLFQDGNLADWLGVEVLDGIDPNIPLVMFAVVFGLSTDYEVFLLSRMQEEWRRTRDNASSVIAGLARTGRIITSAALILLVVVGAFAAGDLVYVKQMGVGMVTAIALDVTIVRALLVPATMQLLGEWNWWAPRWLRRASVPPAERPLAPADLRSS